MSVKNYIEIYGDRYDLADGVNLASSKEESSTAVYAHGVGERFLYMGELYEATQAIAVGGTITPNSNCKRAYLGDEVAQLKSATDDEFSVTRRKMIYYRGENLFDKNNLSDGYMTAAGVVGGSGASYKHTTKIPVIAGETISFWRINQIDFQSTGIIARFLCAFNSDDTAVEASGGTYVNTTYTVPSGITAVVLTFDVAYLAYDVVVKTGAEPPVSYTAYHTPYYMASTDFITPHYQNNPGHWSKSIATLSAITYLPKTNIVKNVIYTFSTKVSNFDSILIGQGYSNQKYETFMTLNTTHATFTLKESGDAREYSFEHGLTIDEFLNITISVNSNAQADVFVQTKGGTYTRTIGWYGYSRGQYCILPGANGTFTDAVFTVSCRDLVHAKTFLFGDSYAANLPDVNRWTHWLVDAGFGDNVMINACPGINTSDTMYPLYNALDVGKPKYLVWTLGMNDGADTGDTPNAAWKTGVDAVISLCKKYDIEPIFCTVPTVPTINHEAKNAWVRSSGYRYIDFARAVGATSSGAWFTGMLSNDNVHPAEPGAKAQWQRVLCDFPEITT